MYVNVDSWLFGSILIYGIDVWQLDATCAMDSDLVCGKYSHLVKGSIMVTVLSLQTK